MVSLSLSQNNKHILSSILISALIIVGIFLFIRFLLGEFNPFYVVVSGSMIPTLQIGDVVVIQNNGNGFGGNDGSSFGHLKKGDIIVFKAPDDCDEDGKPRTIVHRVVLVGFDRRTNEQIVVTKGDNNPQSYLGLDFPIKQDNYIGKVVFILPKIGLLIQVIKPPVNYFITAAAVGIFATYYYKREVKSRNKDGVSAPRDK
jgi:signal peptidase I